MSNSERIATIKNKHFWFLIMETEVPLLTLKYKYLFRPQFLSFWCYWISTCLKCGNMKSFSILYRMLNTHTHRPFWDHRKTECYKKTKGPHKLWLTQSGLPKRKSGQVKWWLCRCHSQERRTRSVGKCVSQLTGLQTDSSPQTWHFFFFFLMVNNSVDVRLTRWSRAYLHNESTPLCGKKHNKSDIFRLHDVTDWMQIWNSRDSEVTLVTFNHSRHHVNVLLWFSQSLKCEQFKPLFYKFIIVLTFRCRGAACLLLFYPSAGQYENVYTYR